MDEIQKQILSRRLKEAYRSQPLFKALRRRLLEIGGEEMVPPMGREPDIEEILERGTAYAADCVVMRLMQPCQCHANSARLWTDKTAAAIGTGYALSEDGLWRQHTWCRDAAGIVETTEERTCYYGFEITGERADRFASLHLARGSHPSPGHCPAQPQAA